MLNLLTGYKMCMTRYMTHTGKNVTASLSYIIMFTWWVLFI